MNPSILIYQIGGRNQFRVQFQRNTTPVVPGGGSPTTSTATPASSTTPITPAVTSPASTSGTPAATPGTSTTPTQSDDPTERNWQALRTQSDANKARAAFLDKLGIPAGKEASHIGALSKLYSEATTLVSELGYDPADFEAAFENDPFGTLQLMRKDKEEAAAARQTAPQQVNETKEQYEARIQQMVKDATKPFTDHLNKQITESTLAKVNTTMTEAITASLPDIPPEVNSLVTDYVTEYLASQPGILASMKETGDMKAVTETVQFVAGRLKDVFTKWTAHEQSRASGGRRTATSSPSAPVRPGGGKSRPSLDDIINDPGVLGDQYASR